MSQRTTNAARAHAKQAKRSADERASGGPQKPTDQRDFPDGPERHPGFMARIRYAFDLTLSRGSGALIVWLGLVTLVFVMLTGLLLHAANTLTDTDRPDSFIENTWQSLMRTLDPGTVTGDDPDWWYRSASLFITLVGIFIFSTLIGLIASVIDRSIEALRKGRGVVPETGHTLVLGWSEKLHTIISELEIANENQRRSCLVVLAPHDRVWMEDEINARRGGRSASNPRGFFSRTFGKLGLSRGVMRVVCRTGNPADPGDLRIVAPTAAKSIIVLTDEGAAAPDAATTKVLLGLMSFDRTLRGMQVLAEFVEADNATAMREATAGQVQTVVSGDLIARITAQICRQAGLGAVYQELLDFDGDEIYFHSTSQLSGATWFQVLQAYPTSSPIGLRRADGKIELNPSSATVLEDGDQVIAISEDDDTLKIDHLVEQDGPLPAAAPAPALDPDHLLMIGWNDLAPRMLRHLAGAVSPGSTLDIVVDPNLAQVHTGELPASPNLEVTLSEADTSRLEPLRDVLGARDFERIVLVGYRELDPAEADARTLLGLVHARRILDAEHRNHGTSIVAELLEPRSVELGQVANPDDFVVSERLTSLLLSQLSENAELGEVFSELLDGTGVEIVMRPIARYVAEGTTAATWGDVVRSAALLGESAIGTLTPGSDAGFGGVVVNPAKASNVDVSVDAQVIVISG